MCKCKKSLQDYEYTCSKEVEIDRYDLWHRLIQDLSILLEKQLPHVNVGNNKIEKWISPLIQLRDILECKHFVKDSLKFLDRNITTMMACKKSKTLEMLTIIDSLGYKINLVEKN